MPEPIRVVFIGTSAAVPSVDRGQSCTAIQFAQETVLVDVGENAQRAIQKFGVRIGKKLTILLTHFHPDHTLGLIGLLTSQEMMGRKRPIQIVAPEGCIDFLKLLFRAYRIRVSYTLQIYEICEQRGKLDMGRWILEWLPALHFPPSYSYIIREKNHPGKFHVEKAEHLGIPRGPLWGKLQRGEKVEISGKIISPQEVLEAPIPGKVIVISGDTSPNKELIEKSKGADLLIHEGTFPADEQEKHERYRHSRTIDAARIALRSKVKYLVINHVSTRIADLQSEEEKVREVFSNLEIATDGREIILRYSKPE